MDRLLNGTCKLLECQIERIRDIRERTGMAYARIAREVFRGKISVSIVYFICNPDKYDSAKISNNKRKGTGRYYDKDKDRESVKKSRKKKRDLFNSSIKKDSDVHEQKAT